MKKLFKKVSAIVLLITGMTVGLVGCGTGPDSGGMSGSSSMTSNSLK